MNIQGTDIEKVTSYKYLGVHMNNELDWTDNTIEQKSEQTSTEEAQVLWGAGGTPDLFL